VSLKVCTHLSTDAGNASAVLELWWWENATANLHHVVADGEPELLNVGVVVEVGATNQIVDFTFTGRKIENNSKFLGIFKIFQLTDPEQISLWL
jgi:hypothetical protein